MNIHIQCCGLVVLLFLLFFYVRQKRVGLFSERYYIKVLLISLGSLVLDILSVVAIAYEEHLPTMILHLICKLYLVSLVWLGYSAFGYVIADLFTEKKYTVLIRAAIAVGVFATILVLFAPIHIYHGSSAVYTYGWSDYLTYFFGLMFIIAATVCAIRFKKLILPRRRMVVYIWLGAWLVASLVQLLNPALLLVGFATSIGMMAIYLGLENPESNIDRALGCFHAHALAAYMEQIFSQKQNISMLLISIMPFQPSSITEDDINESIRHIVQYLDRFPEAKVFKNLEKELVVLCPDMTKLATVFQSLQDQFYQDQFYHPEEGEGRLYKFPYTLFMLIPESNMFCNMDEVMQLIQQEKVSRRSVNSSYVCYANQDFLDQIRKKEQVKAEIIRALDEDRVMVFLQPIYSIKEKKIVSAEALARIQCKDGTYLPPGEFIPVAEECGLIGHLGERIFEKTCAFLRDSNVIDLGIHYIEVNLSVVQCEQRNLAERYIRIMAEYGISPDRINLEITETASVQTKQIMLENMEKLIEHGVSFSLDDFGNGQSNLDYIIDMPVSLMKLDMNMVKQYFEDLKARFVVQAAIRMAHDMDLFLVAEGVETETQLVEMGAQGVDFIQGYYFSKPIPSYAFIDYLKAFNQGECSASAP